MRKRACTGRALPLETSLPLELKCKVGRYERFSLKHGSCWCCSALEEICSALPLRELQEAAEPQCQGTSDQLHS